jgi:hypothetical protein
MVPSSLLRLVRIGQNGSRATYFRGFFFGPGLPLGLGVLSPVMLGPRFAPAAGALRFLLLSDGVEPSARAAGVDADSETWSTESVGLRRPASLGVGAGDGACDDGVGASLGSATPVASASLCFDMRRTTTFDFFAIV